jgi:hypothetical protein
MRRMIAMSCASVLLASVAAGCYIKRETVREPRSDTTIERRTTVDVPETEIRTRTTVERDY